MMKSHGQIAVPFTARAAPPISRDDYPGGISAMYAATYSPKRCVQDPQCAREVSQHDLQALESPPGEIPMPRNMAPPRDIQMTLGRIPLRSAPVPSLFMIPLKVGETVCFCIISCG